MALVLLLMILSTATAATDALLSWLTASRLAPWADRIEADLEDPEKAKHLNIQLADDSAWRAYVVGERRPVVQLVDVLPADPGWESAPLTPADALALQAYLRAQTGVRFVVVLSTETVMYAEAFADRFRETVSYTHLTLPTTYTV